MDMVRHEAVAEYPNVIGARVAREEVHVVSTVAVGMKNHLPVIAALGDVVRPSGG
jgi:hypothetical protein